MNAYSDYQDRKTPRSRAAPGLRVIFPLGGIVRALWRLRQDRRIRSALRDLDRLDERLLKDVGLFREHLPNGATRVRRR